MKTLKTILNFTLQLLAVASVFALAYFFLLLGYDAGLTM